MKSFRVEKQKKTASTQVLLTLLVLVASIVLVRFLPANVTRGNSEIEKTSWESSVVKLP